MLRMTSTGTEAAMSALRLARAATGRDPILKFAGAYHGHVDGLLAQAGSGLATQGIPASPGVPAAAAAATVIVPWNDPEASWRHRRHELAAILAEPVPANMGVVPPQPGFLELLRDVPTHTGALLVFDEVITGFRVAPGGAQERFGVLPDLTILGKIIGGGLPAGAYGGPRELMQRIAPPATSTRPAPCPATRWRWRPPWPRSSASTMRPTSSWRDHARRWRMACGRPLPPPAPGPGPEPCRAC